MPSPALQALQHAIGYTFESPALLERAFTHPSFPEKIRAGHEDLERLEFLGDSVLGFLIAELLLQRYPAEREGELARRHAALVCGAALTGVARSLNLGECLRVSEAEDAAGGRETPSNLEDACEALVGALYLDGGMDAARAFVLSQWEPLAATYAEAPKDAKTTLQEWAQARDQPLPAYRIVSTEGPAHAPLFTVEVSVQTDKRETLHESATGASKKAAEHKAAKQLLDRILSL